MYDVTFHGLHCWYKSLFEKLGWMVLSNAQGQDSSITEYYKLHIKNLMDAINDKKTKLSVNSDKIDDLDIMLRNLTTLLKHVEKDFKKNNLSRINRNNSIRSINVGELNLSYGGKKKMNNSKK